MQRHLTNTSFSHIIRNMNSKATGRTLIMQQLDNCQVENSAHVCKQGRAWGEHDVCNELCDQGKENMA